MRKTAANVEMQGIEFQIINDSDEASKGLDELAKSLSRLKNSIGGSGTQISKAAEGIRQIKNAIKDTKLSSFESGMRRISESLKPLGEMKFTSVTSFMKQINAVNPENLEKIAAIDFSNLKEAAENAKAISGVSGVTSRISSATTGNSMPPLEDAGVAEMPAALMESKQGLEETREQAEAATAALRNTTKTVQSTVSPFKELASHAKKLASSLKNIAKNFLQVAIGSSGLSSRLKDLVKSFGRIVKYRAIRSVIAGITSSLREGIQNLVQYSAAMNSMDSAQANKTMSEYASTLQQVKNSIGAAVMPALNALLPLVNSIANAFITATNAINQFFSALSGKGTFTKATKNAVDYAGSLSGAASAAKELKRTVMGFDELNLLNDQSSGSGGSGGSGTNYGDMFEESEIAPGISSTIEAFKEKFEPFIEWFERSMERIKNASDFSDLKSAISDMSTELATLLNSLTDNISWDKIGSSIGSGLDLAFTFAANFITTYDWKNLGNSIAELLNNAISEIDWENAGTLMWGKFKIAIEFFAGLIENIDAAELAASFSEFTISLINSITETIKNVDWEQVGSQIGEFLNNLDWQGILGSVFDGLKEALKGAIEGLSGFEEESPFSTLVELILGIKVLKKIAGKDSILEILTGSNDTVKGVKDKIEPISTNTSTLTTKLTDLAKNIGLGVAILAEVAAGAIIFAGAIAVLGWELDKVGQAWQPVIDNAATVAIAVGVGTGLLAAIGVVCYALGTLGGTAALNIGIGTAILLELGVATGLFIAEIWAIGKGLDEIGQAWKPVLDNGDEIATAIGIGTGLLVAIGAATAALGAATTATGFLLPAAILVGVGVLYELGEAFKALVGNLVTVANQLSANLAPALANLNDILPELKTDMHNFVVLMGDLAGEISDYTKSMRSITWSSIVGEFQKLFSGDPIGGLADDVNTIYEDAAALNEKLSLAIPELRLAVSLLMSYQTLMEQLQELIQNTDASTLSSDMFTNLQFVGEQLVLGFVTGINAKASLLTTKVNELKATVNTAFSDMGDASYSAWNSAFDKMEVRFDEFKTKTMEALNDYSKAFSNEWVSIWESAGNTFVRQWNVILDRLEDGINEAIVAVNRTIREFNKLVGLTGTNYSYVSKISIPNISYMKNGGFVDEGELFIAREAGAEMVGAIGRRTAVANNDQIVESVSNGVSIANDGVIAAIYALINAVEGKDMSVSIGDDEIGHSYDRYKQKRGVEVSSGAFANSY